MAEERIKPRIDEYHGRPALVIPTGTDREGKEYEFSMTILLARAVLEYHEEILDFVKAHE